ncbi:unnamed protein product [Acanthocheilonema viteae]|uniref:Uncharacterized protein n=1 Tax=Acanthocheilonema viteae TaxID=6277 RepID=A0A498SMT9_ACAVI|nr:unnamed protein product [Acanthocheilonema viteae]
MMADLLCCDELYHMVYSVPAVELIAIYRLPIDWTSFAFHTTHSNLAISLTELQTSEISTDNIVNLAVYIEAQCPDTSRFVHRQLLSTWQELSVTNRISLKIVPFGKAKCDPVGDSDYSCECQHGPAECELNQLMNCVIEMVRNPHYYVPVISCIQGKRDLRSAGLKCLSKLLMSSKSILLCAEGKEGRRLLAKAGAETERLQPPLNFVPWIMINEIRSSDAFYDLKKNLCDALDPIPDQCKEHNK